MYYYITVPTPWLRTYTSVPSLRGSVASTFFFNGVEVLVTAAIASGNAVAVAVAATTADGAVASAAGGIGGTTVNFGGLPVISGTAAVTNPVPNSAAVRAAVVPATTAEACVFAVEVAEGASLSLSNQSVSSLSSLTSIKVVSELMLSLSDSSFSSSMSVTSPSTSTLIEVPSGSSESTA